MVGVGEDLSTLENWAKGRLEYDFDLDSNIDDYTLSTEVLSDDKESNPIDGTSRNVIVKLELQYDGTDLIPKGSSYTINFFKYAGDQSFWTNGVINDAPMY